MCGLNPALPGENGAYASSLLFIVKVIQSPWPTGAQRQLPRLKKRNTNSYGTVSRASRQQLISESKTAVTYLARPFSQGILGQDKRAQQSITRTLYTTLLIPTGKIIQPAPQTAIHH